MLKVTGLNKSFGNLQVLKEVDFEVKKGEIVSVIGASGSGKSTLLRTLNYLEKADDGVMEFDKEFFRMHDVSEKDKLKVRKRVSMVFQNYHLFKNKTALENIIESLIITQKMNKKDAVKIGEDMLEMVGLSDKRDSYPHQLSGGQQQRVGIARAVAVNPDIILFDEPTSALDPELVGEVLNVIRKVAKRDTTMIIVTHEMSFAKEISDRVAFMSEGKIAVDGTPEEVFEKSEDSRIVAFLKRFKEN